MNNRSFSRLRSVAFLAAVLAAPAAGALSLLDGNEVTRSSEGIELSGITWAGGDTFYAVNDDNSSNRLYRISVSLGTNGQIAAYSVVSSVKLSGSSDLEGCAYDPASGNVWVSMEGGNASIREYDPETGAMLRTAPIPDVFKNNMRGNFKFEALTISGDGLTMWTANEEALTCDGQISAKPRSTGGTTVRLLKYTRDSVRDNWTAAAQYAYKTYGLNYAYAYQNTQRSGVSGLCALPDGRLLVLEREFSGTDDNSNLSSIWTGISCHFTMAVVLADCSSASDVSTLPSLAQATYTPVSKTDLYNGSTGFANYEGICLGPRNADGSVSLLFISDGGGNSFVPKNIMSKNLSGLDVRTLYVEGAAESEPVGGPYRHVGGSTVTASLPGGGGPYEALLRVRPAWAAATNNASGEGGIASFAIAADDVLRWSALTNANLPMIGCDSFERIAVGTEAGGFPDWTGDGAVAAASYAPPFPAGFPLASETHEQVLAVDGEAVRDYPELPGGPGALLDLMVRVTREREDEDGFVVDIDGRAALLFDAQGRPTLRHAGADGAGSLRTTLSPRLLADGDWIRASFAFDCATDPSGAAWCQVRLDGEPCVTDAGVRSPADPRAPGSWYRTLDGAAAPGRVSRLVLRGSGAVDDVALYDAAGAFEFWKPAATTNGVPCVWLAGQGLPWNPAADADGDTFDDRTEYLVGTDPWNERSGDAFRIVEAGFDGSGRYALRFLGRADRATFDVCTNVDLSAPEGSWGSADGEIVPAGPGTNLWTQAEAPADGESVRFFRVRATLPEDQARP